MIQGHDGGDGTAINARRLLWAGFFAILAASVGFGVRGGILANWGSEFGLTGAQLGQIGGAGLTGFCFGIIIAGLVADAVGYGVLVGAAFVLQIAAAAITLSASADSKPDVAFLLLYWGAFVFSVAHGTLEGIANPLVATLFPQNRTHYLNILHASWPAGMVLGGVIGWTLGDQMHVDWKIQFALFLVPTAIYGLMFLGQRMPQSEASARGLGVADMLKDVGLLGAAIVCLLLGVFFQDAMHLPTALAWGLAAAGLVAVGLVTGFSPGAGLLFVLFVAMGMVGTVELGTDTWIQNITGNILTSPEGKVLFVFTSALMFLLRFCAGFIEKRVGLSPVGILFTCAVLACVGLLLVSGVTTFAGALPLIGVYAIGKTFFWPTMLAVASDRYPRTGAIAISIMGGIGMMAGGLIGSAGLGYAKDRFAAEELRAHDPAALEEFKAAQPSRFLFLDEVTSLDGTKLGDITKKITAARDAGSAAPLDVLTPRERAVHEASIEGDRRTLVANAFVPGTMAIVYLLLLVWFKSIGGYRPVRIDESAHD